MSFTVAFITGRRDPKFEWFFQSLARQKGASRVSQIIIVDFYAQEGDGWTTLNVAERTFNVASLAVQSGFSLDIVDYKPPKPTIWQGPHRVTKENWWAASSARNTAFALCRNEWIAVIDDRCVLQPDWIQAIKRALGRKFAVFGAYQKQHNLTVEHGVVVKEGTITGVDNREALAQGKLVTVDGAWAYGCAFALPLEWALQVNGFAEDYCDGISMEDIIFGMCLHNNGYRMRYDPTMKVIQDRTPSELDKPFRREDKGVSPLDKSHKLLDVFAKSNTSLNKSHLRAIRRDVLAGKPFPIPSDPNPLDWYDQSPIRGL